MPKRDKLCLPIVDTLQTTACVFQAADVWLEAVKSRMSDYPLTNGYAKEVRQELNDKNDALRRLIEQYCATTEKMVEALKTEEIGAWNG